MMAGGKLDGLAGHLPGHGLGALLADVFAPEVGDVVRVAAKDACRLVLLEDDLFLVDVDLQSILFGDSQGAAQLDGNDYSPELVHFSDDTS
jgi:hypothetical protein